MYLRIIKYTISFKYENNFDLFFTSTPQDLLQDKNVVTTETVGKQILRIAETTGDTALRFN